MTTEKSTASSRRYTRKPPQQVRPNRRAGNFYRTAEGPEQALGGVPLGDINAAVVAAVRMGYKVAEAQIERSARLAKRLRDAGDQAVGPDSERKALDGAERLVFRTMMSGLGWLEAAAAAERGSPLKRLMEAEYKMMGALFGITPPDAAQAAPDVQSGRAGYDATATRSPAASATPVLRIRHKGPESERRPVRVAHWELVRGASIPSPVQVQFFSVEKLESDPLAAEFVASASAPATLSIATKRLAQTGLWRGAICDADGLQLGLIELIL
jgi:hypothetical protein